MAKTRSDRVLSVAAALLIGLSNADSPVVKHRHADTAFINVCHILGANSKKQEDWICSWAEKNVSRVETNKVAAINSLILEYGNKFGPTSLPKKTAERYVRIAERQYAEKRIERLRGKKRLSEAEKLELSGLWFKYRQKPGGKKKRPLRNNTPKSKGIKPVRVNRGVGVARAREPKTKRKIRKRRPGKA